MKRLLVKIPWIIILSVPATILGWYIQILLEFLGF